jgi:uncharacterized protein (DUF305 family)
VLAFVIAGLIAQATPQTPPIFQPGAPGAPSRAITAREAVELSRSTYTAGDVQFMQHMIVHHRQAVDMVELLQTRVADQRVRLLGDRIRIGQETEMIMMRGWLAARGEAEVAPMDHSAHAMHAGMDHDAHAGHQPAPEDVAPMPGMLTPRQMGALAAAHGPEFDRLFLQGMIQHHQGALGMVDALQAQPDAAEDPMLADFINSVVADQSAEILRMQTVLSDLCSTC